MKRPDIVKEPSTVKRPDTAKRPDTMRKSVIIVGSLNMDFVVQVDSLPERGQTVPGRGFQMIPGGKGANQACAVGKLGGDGHMIGRVGEDVFGEKLKASLQAAGVDVSRVLPTEGESSGVALIFVERGGQNMIVVAPGSNGLLSPHDVAASALAFEGGRILLLQLESPMETVAAAAALARSRGMTTILDPAPARPLSPSLLRDVDILTPNETEALVLLGRPPSCVSLEDAPGLAAKLLEMGPRRVILKLGEKGAWLADREKSSHFGTARVEAVDATAAGDVFNGALAVAISEGKGLQEAIPFANRAAAISVTRLGAQASVPTRAEVDAASP
jgi:ribokinase